MGSLIKSFLHTKMAKRLAGFMFSRGSRLLPVKKLRENSTWLAFIHHKPCYPIHIVIVPKREIDDWMSLPLEDPALYADFVELSQGMIRDFCLEETGYRLIINGGPYQTFPHLHAHLVAGDVLSKEQ